MKRIYAFALTLALFMGACGPGDGYGRVGQALVGNYNLGWTGVTDDVLASPIHSLLFDSGRLPFVPLAPSASMAFQHFWGVDNGGTAAFTDNGVHFNGNLNSINFQLWLVKQVPATAAYYALAINSCYTTDGSHGACQNSIAAFTAWPQWRMTGSWQNNQLGITVYDQNNNTVTATMPVSWSFLVGSPMLTHVYSPEVLFTLDTNADSFGGCKNEILQYDDNVNDIGHYSPKTLYGTGSVAGTPAYLSAPSSNSKCSMQVNHVPQASYDQVQWKVLGF